MAITLRYYSDGTNLHSKRTFEELDSSHWIDAWGERFVNPYRYWLDRETYPYAMLLINCETQYYILMETN